jgi:tetratricopeptide (TPR) repeat protein
MSVQAEIQDSTASCRGVSRFSVIRRWLAPALVLSAVAVGGVYYWYSQRAPQQFARAWRALAAGRWGDVERALVKLEGHTAYDPHRHFLRGALLLEQGENLRALDEFGFAVEHPDLRVATLTLSGEAAYKAGYLQAAMGLLIQATELAPDSRPALRWLASAYYDLGLNEGAIRTLTRVAELDPGDPRPHRLMGTMYKDFENYTVAVEHFRESLRRDGQQPDHEQILLDLADCQISLRQPEAALETLANGPLGAGSRVPSRAGPAGRGDESVGDGVGLRSRSVVGSAAVGHDRLGTGG